MVAVALVATAVLSSCASAGPDTVLLNGRIFTADPAQPWVEALAVRGERVIATGDTATVAALAGSATVRRDLGGRLVVPGFNDAHVDRLPAGAPAIRATANLALTTGVTSLHVFSTRRPVAETVRDLIDAAAPQRFRVFRAPRPEASGATVDSRPHLPPQPTFRIDVRGMGFALGAADVARIRQAAGWAYGSEDPLAIEPTDAEALAGYMLAIEQTGLAEVWTLKRPRIERLRTLDASLAPRLARYGVVVVQRPGLDAGIPLASVLRAGVTLALASGGDLTPLAVLQWATAPDRGDERLTMDEAVTAMTRGSAFAEFADRDRRGLLVGALADLAVLSDDLFEAPAERLPAIRSVLTMIGGRAVYDVP